MIEFLLERFRNASDKEAFVCKGESFTYEWLLERFEFWNGIVRVKLSDYSVVGIISDFTPDAVALLLSLIQNRKIIAPLSTSQIHKKDELFAIGEVQVEIILSDGNYAINDRNQTVSNEMLLSLIESNSSGLLLFSSGTSGVSKAALHDFSKFLQKYSIIGKDYRTLAFMLFDHVGGVDTLFYSMSNASTIIIAEQRTPVYICKVIESAKVEVLPTTPTFLNLLLLSNEYRNYDLSSLKFITYGSEPMPNSTLQNCIKAFPNIKFIQKYGTTEIGTPRSKSKDNGSLWVKLGGEDFQTRVVDGILQIKSKSAMIGYLNAPSPFTEDGWFITGDSVEVDGEYYRIMGRESEIINVGGEKVYPSEIENVIIEFDNVEDVTVYGEKNPILGNMVCATVQVKTMPEDEKEFKNDLKSFCNQRLLPYKVPVKIKISLEKQFTSRLKKARLSNV